MHERDLEPEHALPGLGVDQLGATAGEVEKRGTHVLHLVGDVVHTGPAIGEEPAHRRVRFERREQLDTAGAHTHRRSLDSLVLDAGAVLDTASEQPLVRPNGRVEVVDRETDVMDAACLHFGDRM